MKLHIARADLLAGLNLIKSAAASRSTLPILANVSLSTLAKKVEMVATNLNQHIRTRVVADVDDQGSCTVNAALLYGLVQSFSGASVELVALKSELKVNCGDSKYRLGSLPFEDFPPIPKIKEPTEFKLPQHILHGLLAATAFCQSDDESRHVLCGSFLRLNGVLTSVATDGRRLAMDESELDGENPKTGVILPNALVHELLRLLNPDDPEDEKKAPLVYISVTANLVQFEFEDTVIVSKLIEGNYPDYTRVIPDLTGGIAIGRADLLNALKRIAMVAERCDLEFKGQMLTLKSRAAKGAPGEACETLLIPKSPEVNVAFEARYLIEALEAVDADQVEIVARNKAPAVIKVPGTSWLSVICGLTTAEPEPAKPAPKPEEPKAPVQEEIPAAAAAK